MSLSERQQKAQEIANSPDLYMVCEGCDSIVMREAHMCPNCHAYRFNAEPDVVIEKAIELGGREQRSISYEDLI